MVDTNNNNSLVQPASRRGIGASAYLATMNDSSTTSPAATMRPGTTIKPPSALRSGTASRLAANSVIIKSSIATQRIGTALGNAGNKMSERPITQHGISGLTTSYSRPGATASGSRQIKDKRYWQALLQSKIHEISYETSKLLNDKKFLDRERSARKLYEKRVKDAAKDLTNLQSTLTSMNLALDNCSSGMTRQHLLNETVALREQNEHIQEQLELIFKQRQLKDTENRGLENETAKEKNKSKEMINSLTNEEQRKYRDLQFVSENLQKQNTMFHSQISEMEKQKERLLSTIANSQSRAEAHRLKLKLKELSAKRNSMYDEANNRLTPAQEREKLIIEVRSNNKALSGIGRQLKIIEDQLNEKKELWQQIQHDLEEGNSERHIKYKELKKRDEVMSSFLNSFRANMDQEKQSIELLKNQITFAIEQITLQGINMKGFRGDKSDKLDNEEIISKNDLSSHAGLIKEYKKLSIVLKQLQILEKRTREQVNGLRKEETDAMHLIQKYMNLEIPRSTAIIKMNDLSSALQELDDKKRVTDNVVEEARSRHQELKVKLKSNETYRQLSHLEEKLIDILKENKTLQSTFDQLQQENDYSPIHLEVNAMVNEYNTLLCSETDPNFINNLF